MIIGRQVRLDDGHQVRRDAHVAGPGVGLGSADDELPGHPDHTPADAQDALGDVDITTAQLGQLPEPETAPRGQQHHEPVPLGHGQGEGLELGQGGGSKLHALRVAAPSDVTGVEVEEAALHRVSEDGAQEPVGVRSGGRGAVPQR